MLSIWWWLNNKNEKWYERVGFEMYVKRNEIGASKPGTILNCRLWSRLVQQEQQRKRWKAFSQPLHCSEDRDLDTCRQHSQPLFLCSLTKAILSFIHWVIMHFIETKRWNSPKFVLTNLMPDLSCDRIMTDLWSVIKWISATIALWPA
jgi:hypothetical protein